MKDSLTSQKKNLSGLIVLVLFGVFAVCILAVLLSGTSVYNRLVGRDEKTFDDRTAAQYISTRIHSALNADAVSIMSVDGSDAIRISESYDGEEYQTLLYCREGWLYELFTTAEGDMDALAGERILLADSIHGTIENGLLRIRLKDANGEQVLLLSLRGGRCSHEQK